MRSSSTHSSMSWLSALSLAMGITMTTLPQPASAFPSDAIAPFTPAWIELSSEDALLFNSSSSSSSESSSSDDGSESSPHHDLVRRANSCPSHYNACTALSASGVCCSTNAVCSLDAASQVACCPLGSYCTGTISSASRASTATTTATGSYVSNSFFPFPYVSTTFSDASACSVASSACASNYALCTADLAGVDGAYGVTISAPNGGVTVAAAASTSIGAASASSVCASLSSAAGCAASGVQTCSTYTGTATATGTATGGVVTVTVTSTGGFSEGTSAAVPGMKLPGLEAWMVVAAAVMGMLGGGMIML